MRGNRVLTNGCWKLKFAQMHPTVRIDSLYSGLRAYIEDFTVYDQLIKAIVKSGAQDCLCSLT